MKNIRVFIYAIGVFSIINTEMGVIGILPMIAENYEVSITNAGLLVSLFALAVAIAGPTMPLLCSRFNRKHVMIVVLGMFLVCNMIAAFSTQFQITLLARSLPAFFHPVYISMALSVSASSVDKEQAPKEVSKIMMGVSAGMVLGAPIASFLATSMNVEIAMLFFAFMNLIALVCTCICVPSLPVQTKLSYGSQLQILKHKKTWIAFIGVVLLNGSVFGMYSYITQYLTSSAGLSMSIISIVLLLYGLANIVGNGIAGKALSGTPTSFIFKVAVVLGIVYVAQLIVGDFAMVLCIVILVWGVLAGCIGNINQYWMTSVAPDAPDFANGLFLSSTNLGTTIATSLCSITISSIGIQQIPLVGIILLLLSMGCMLLHMKRYTYAN